MLRDDLKARLQGTVLVVGIGNTLRGDDGFGGKLHAVFRRHARQIPIVGCAAMKQAVELARREIFSALRRI